ncbi:hypothetical protein [Streptomyces xinghaiensis]|uniref:hypothetical protein n=1 Tax=Streptomyces xinghaiensis TaxID=1038928 RepID=UPI002E0F57AE|nr:hypothetical protein OG463_24750 [Streptomyces xinghaiensis]
MRALHPAALTGDGVFRIHWLLGTDRLLAVCHCGAERQFEDPEEVWDWLLGHPEDHHPGTAVEPGGSDPTRPRPHPVPA